jgi:hypothetical protein
MKFSIFAIVFATALSLSSTLAAPTDASSRDVEGRQVEVVVAVIGAVVTAYEGISNAINEEVNKDNLVCRILPKFQHELTFKSRVALNSPRGPFKRWPPTILDGIT